MKCTKIMTNSYNNIAAHKSNVNFRNRNEVDHSKSYYSGGSYGSGMRDVEYTFNRYGQPLMEKDVYINTSGPNPNFIRGFSYYDDGKLKSVTQTTPAGITAPSKITYFQHDKSVYYPPVLNQEAQAIFKTYEGKDGKTMKLNHYFLEGELFNTINVFFKKGQEFPSRIYAFSSKFGKLKEWICEEGFKNARIVGNAVCIG